MLSISMAWLLAAQVVGASPMPADKPAAKGPVVSMETSKGRIVIELYREQAPLTVANFIKYVRGGFYDGTIFHRVVASPSLHVIQGGGFDQQLAPQPTRPPVKNESRNGLSNRRGTIAMARTTAPDSATSQFYINTADNTFLDGTPERAGYAVFGAVIEGLEVVDKIAAVPTHSVKGMSDVPIDAVLIKRVREAATSTRQPSSAPKAAPRPAAATAR